MFKIAGLVCIVLSSIYILNRRLIFDYMTSLFLKDTLKLMQMLKLGCHTGKTYRQIIENCGIATYKNFDISDSSTFFDSILINRDVKNEIKAFFDNIGKNTSDSEEEYIKQAMEFFSYRAKKLQEHYDLNCKSGIVAGVSLGIIIFIVII